MLKNSFALMLIGVNLLASFLFISCEENEVDSSKKINKRMVYSRNIPFEKTQKYTYSKPIQTKNKIYLTFDDGPNKGTAKLLQIVDKQNVPVSVFLIGAHVYGSKTQTSDFFHLKNDRLFCLANHSYSHAKNNYQKFYSDPHAVVLDFKRSNDSLQFQNKLIRTPGRNIWRTQKISVTDIKASKNAADSLYMAGFEVIGWDLEWHFDKDLKLKENSDLMVKQINTMLDNKSTRTEDHLVLLVHDQVFVNEENQYQLNDFLQKLKENETFELERIDQYPGLKIRD